MLSGKRQDQECHVTPMEAPLAGKREEKEAFLLDGEKLCGQYDGGETSGGRDLHLLTKAFPSCQRGGAEGAGLQGGSQHGGHLEENCSRAEPEK